MAAIDQGANANEWFSEFLKMDVELVPGKKNAMFGQNVVHENTGLIHLGSKVKILKT